MESFILQNTLVVLYHKNYLILSNDNARVVLNVALLKSLSCVIFFSSNILGFSLNALEINSDFKNRLRCSIQGLDDFYFRKLNLIGIGFRSWIVFDKNGKKMLMLKFGFSKHIIFTIPKQVIIICLRPTLILIKGPNKKLTNLVAARIRFLKRLDIYKGKGVFYENENITLKIGKQK